MEYVKAFFELFSFVEILLMAIVVGMAIEGILGTEKHGLAVNGKQVGVSSAHGEFIAKHKAQ